MRNVICAALLLLAATASGQTPNAPTLSLTIEGLSNTEYGFEVKVRVKNSGTKPVVLELSGTKKPMLQSLSVQQWDEKLGWQEVGPCLDVPPSKTRSLSPLEEVEDVVKIGDVAHGWVSSVCPRRIQHLEGRIRAVMYCSYISKRSFDNRMKSKEPCREVVSPSVKLPK